MRTSSVLFLVLVVMTFPLWFGLGIGFFGLVIGLLGAMVGLAFGLIGALVGVFAWVINGLISIISGRPFDSSLSFDFDFFPDHVWTLAVVVVLVIWLTRRKTVARTQR
jgi:hypothetical protein